MTSSENISTKLNPVQLHLLQLFSKSMTNEELAEIKKILSDYYFKKVETEVDAFWEKKDFTIKKWNKATRDVHLRSKKSKEQ